MWKQSEVNCCSMYVYVYHSYVRTYVYNAVRSIMYNTYICTYMHIRSFANQVAYSTDTPNNDDDGDDGNNTGANTGAIVGGVVGGSAGAMLLILPIILLLLCYIRKRREKSSIASMECMCTVVCVYILSS